MPDWCDELTFVVFTFNEEKRIERVLRNFKPFGKILVVDNESSDRTIAIAEHYGCDVLSNKNTGWVEDEITTSRVKAKVQTPWIYWGFADEMVDTTALSTIIAAIRAARFDIINIARKNHYYGTFCGDLFADRMNRIFKKEAIDFSGNKLHEFGRVVPGSRILELPLKYFVHHFISNTAKSYLNVMDRYTDMESRESRPTPTMLRLFLSGVKTILVNLVLRGGHRVGPPAYFLVSSMVYYRWLSAMKLYERRIALDRDVIEAKNDAVRDGILKFLE